MKNSALILLALSWLVLWFAHAQDNANYSDSAWSSETMLTEIVSIEFRTPVGTSIPVRNRADVQYLLNPFTVRAAEGVDYPVRFDFEHENRVGHVVMRLNGSRLRSTRRPFMLYRDPWALQGLDDPYVDIGYKVFGYPEPIPEEREAILIEIEQRIQERR